jgi:hypothetical protein
LKELTTEKDLREKLRVSVEKRRDEKKVREVDFE